MKKLLQIGGVLVIVVAVLPTNWSGDAERMPSKELQDVENSSQSLEKKYAEPKSAIISTDTGARRDPETVEKSEPNRTVVGSRIDQIRGLSSERGITKQVEQDGYFVRWIGRTGMVPVIRKFKLEPTEKSAIEWLADSLILTTRAPHSPEELLSGLAVHGVTAAEPLNLERRQWKVSILPNTLEDFFTISEGVKRSSLVETVGHNFILKTGEFPNDPLLPMQYGFGSADTTAFVQDQVGGGFLLTPQNSDANVRADLAWATKRDCSAISIAVIDSGIDSGHPDLSQNLDLATSRNFVSEAVLNDDCSQNPMAIPSGGSPTVASKYNDENGHGTHVAGTIAAIGNNGVGVSGVCWNAKIVTIRTMNKCGRGSSDSILAGINYAAQSKIRIVNMSLGGNAGASDLAPGSNFYEAIAAVGNAGGLVIAAAGNDNTDNSVNLKFPASVNHPALVAVASHNAVNQISGYSNFSSTAVHIAAPGEGIVSTIPLSITSDLSDALSSLDINGLPAVPKFKQAAMNFPAAGYDVKNGTSMAAPHVAGVAALVWSMDPARTNSEIKEILYETSDSVPDFASKVVSGRRVNLGRAINAAGGLSVKLDSPTSTGSVFANVAKEESVYVKLNGEQATKLASGGLFLGSSEIGKCSAFDGTCVGRIPNSINSESSLELTVKSNGQPLAAAGSIRVLTLSDGNGLFASEPNGMKVSCRVSVENSMVASFKASSSEACINVCRMLSARALDGKGVCSFGDKTQNIQAEACNAADK